MPIYEYICANCGEEFEELVFGRAAPPCPACGSDRNTRLMSRACVHAASGDYDAGSYDAPSGGSCGCGGGCGGCSGGNCAGCC